MDPIENHEGSHDCIYALATPALPAAIALIRISGPNLGTRLRPLFEPTFSWPPAARNLKLCKVIDPKSDQILDQPLLAFFPAPHSFTGEDVAEFNLHGSPYIVRRLMEILDDLGLRQAKPGEFSKRAFLQGKMDLSQAEGLRELIHSQTSDQWKAARDLAEGKLLGVITLLRTSIIEALAYLEAQIDFPEEDDTAHLNIADVTRRVGEVEAKIDQLLGSYQSGRIQQHGLQVAIVGPPNAGKSTLLNALLGKERAIVTDIPGTTRDYLEASCIINGRLVRLIDTAGIRDTNDQIEKIGIQQALDIATQSDLVLILVPPQNDFDALQKAIVENRLINKPKLYLQSKADLVPSLPTNASRNTDCLWISAHLGAGIEALRTRIDEHFTAEVSANKSEVFISNLRHLKCLQHARASLTHFAEMHQQQAYAEMLAFELRDALRHLQGIIGNVDIEDILDKVFSEFCLGK